MKVWAAVACVCVVTVLSIGCDAPSRYRVLTFFFDGVPPPRTAGETEGGQAAIVNGVQPRQIGLREHGPYGAKLCTACHESAATNTFVVPRDQLCFRCHDIRLDKKYIHGPLASGGCTACHDPHSSRYRYLLVSESETFCLHCHDRDAIQRIGAHAGHEEQCTSCHNPHMSDNKYLLR
jgi:predicted CXXCH cytochrome family protein